MTVIGDSERGTNATTRTATLRQQGKRKVNKPPTSDLRQEPIPECLPPAKRSEATRPGRSGQGPGTFKEVLNPDVRGERMRSAVGVVSTPEQQAALTDLLNGAARRRYLAALAATGNTEDAARIADLDPWTVYHWRKQDASLAVREAEARQRFGQKLLSKTTAAVLAADPEQLVKTPTLAIAAVNWYNPELRPQGPGVQVAVQVNVQERLTSEQRQQIAAALYDDDGG